MSVYLQSIRIGTPCNQRILSLFGARSGGLPLSLHTQRALDESQATLLDGETITQATGVDRVHGVDRVFGAELGSW